MIFHIATRNPRPSVAEAYAAATIRARLAELAPHIKRVTIHIDESLDRNGHPTMVCRVKVALATALDVESFVVEGHAKVAREAVDLVVDAIEGAVRRPIEEAAKARLRRRGKTTRVSAAAAAKEAAARTPPKELVLRHARVEPALEGRTTARPPRGKHFHMTRHQAGATSAREVATGAEPGARPSRKSTRKSANRSKRDSNQARRATRGIRSPEARARGRSG